MCLSQHGAVSCRFAIHTQLLKKKHIESFSQVDVTRSTFFAGKKTKKTCVGPFFQKNVSEHKGSQEARWTGASTMVMSEHDALS